MSSPFPGMDPWLEHPALWSGLHQSLVTRAHDRLQAQLGGRYYAEMGERVFIEVPDRSVYPDVAVLERARGPAEGEPPAGPLAPDHPTVVVLVDPVERREVFIEIRDSHREDKVVTVIEVLSWSNKRPGPGRDLYLKKQGEILASDAHLVEVDLLRGGHPTVACPRERLGEEAYRVVVCRAERLHELREVYAFGLRDRLPRVGIPLVAPDRDVVLDLPAILAEAYERGAYARRLDYGRDPIPPLAPEDLRWARERRGAAP